MNLLYRSSDSRNGFVPGILESLRTQGVFEKCTVITQAQNETYDAKYYNEIPAAYGYFCNYEKWCDLYNLPAISIDMWEALKPYKDEIINMTHRNYHTHVLNYFEMDKQYTHHVRFWNYVLDHDEIGMAYFAVAPHGAWEFTIYALCKIKGIPTLIMDEHWMYGLATVFTDIAHNGINVKKCFDKYDHIETDEYMQTWYNRCAGERAMFTPAMKKADLKLNRDFERKNFLGTPWEDIKNVSIQVARKLLGRTGGDNFDLDYAWYHAKHRRDARKKMRGHDTYWYDKRYAEHAVEGEEYILFPLQYMPEATLLPKSGVCSNQILSIELLASAAAKRGIKVYVKEHYVQSPRDKAFYDDLLRIPNVRIIHMDDSTGDLQDKAFAVACQTGRCLVESIIKCVPTLNLAYTCVAEAPGAFWVKSEQDIIDAIDAIRAGLDLDPEVNKRYYAAIYKTSVKCQLDWLEKPIYPISEIQADIVRLIKSFVEAGMPDDFYYERED